MQNRKASTSFVRSFVRSIVCSFVCLDAFSILSNGLTATSARSMVAFAAFTHYDMCYLNAPMSTEVALTSFVVRRSSFVVRRSSFVVRRSSFVVRSFRSFVRPSFVRRLWFVRRCPLSRCRRLPLPLCFQVAIVVNCCRPCVAVIDYGIPGYLRCSIRTTSKPWILLCAHPFIHAMP